MNKSLKKNKANALRRFLKENQCIWASCLAAFVIMMIIYYCYGLFPFGDKTILRMDMYHQYGPLYAELYDRITGGGSFLYSWETGLGGSFLGNFFNYLASPLSFMILLFGHKNMPEAIAAIILVKAVLSAGTFTYYLKASQKQHSLVTAAFGILYAFCGFFIAYYWNLMWLDAMVLFPLVLLGIEKIINSGKPLLYCTALTVTLISNYYMAYMVCLFSVLYFLVYYFSNYTVDSGFYKIPYRNEDESRNKVGLVRRLQNSRFWCSGTKFAFYSVAAAGISAFMLIPLIGILSNCSATSGSFPESFKQYFTAFDFIANHLSGLNPTIRSSGTDVLPNVYCGMLTVLLFPLYFFCKQISMKEKALHLGLLGVLYLSFNINYLNYIWHGFHFPNDLPYRFSFMYSFVLLLMAYKVVLHIQSITKAQILTSGMALAALLVLIEEITSKNVDKISLLVSILSVIFYVMILSLFKDKRAQKNLVCLLLLCTVFAEITLGSTDHYSMNQSKENYAGDYEDFRIVKEQLDERDKDFYRMELTSLRARMDPAWYNYNGVSTFSSMAYEKVANMQSQVGMYSNYINSYTYHLQTPIYNSMFGLKYIVDNSSQNMNPSLYREILSQGKFTAYTYKYPLPVMFAANSDVADWTASDFSDPFLAQEDWFRLASGATDVFERMYASDLYASNLGSLYEDEINGGYMSFDKDTSNTGAGFSFDLEVQKTQNVYVYLKCSQSDNITISSGDYSKELDIYTGFIVDLGVREAGEIINFYIPIKEKENSGSFTFYAYGLNEDAFADGYSVLEKGGMDIREYSDTHMVGSLTATENQVVYTSIPYDTGWSVYVDGQKLSKDEILAVSEALMAFHVTAGEHEIEIRYRPEGLYLGIAISVMTVLLLLAVYFINRKLKAQNATDKWKLVQYDDSGDYIFVDTQTERKDEE